MDNELKLALQLRAARNGLDSAFKHIAFLAALLLVTWISIAAHFLLR